MPTWPASTPSSFRAAIAGARRRRRRSRQMTGTRQPAGDPAAVPRACAERIWWGAGTRATAVWTAEQGMNLMSSTLLTEDTGVPFDELQAEQIAALPRGLEEAPATSASRACR